VAGGTPHFQFVLHDAHFIQPEQRRKINFGTKVGRLQLDRTGFASIPAARHTSLRAVTQGVHAAWASIRPFKGWTRARSRARALLCPHHCIRTKASDNCPSGRPTRTHPTLVIDQRRRCMTSNIRARRCCSAYLQVVVADDNSTCRVQG
jgi:hypothetical protein